MMKMRPQTAPTFLLSTDEDTVPPENMVQFYVALRKTGVPAEMHIFENGPNRIGLDLEESRTRDVADAADKLAARTGLLTK
jgi:dipeptidyl aminopeptidase/acylaminoacyl peptidase